MKNVWIYVLTFMMGSAAGFLITKKVYKEKYAALAQEEIDSVKEHFTVLREVADQSHIRPVYDESGEIIPTEIEKTIVQGEAFAEGLKKGLNPIAGLTRSSLDGTATNRYDQAKKNYDVLLKTPEKINYGPGSVAKILGKEAHTYVTDDLPENLDDQEPDDEDTDDAGGTEEDSERKAPTYEPPHVITGEEFSDGYPHHDKLSLYFYTEDEVVCDENEEIVSDVEGVLGEDLVNEFDTQNMVWVRNESLGIDYEIVAIHKSYVRDVLGEVEDDQDAKELRARKRREFRQE